MTTLDEKLDIIIKQNQEILNLLKDRKDTKILNLLKHTNSDKVCSDCGRVSFLISNNVFSGSKICSSCYAKRYNSKIKQDF